MALYGVASIVGIGCGNVDATGSTSSEAACWFVGAINLGSRRATMAPLGD